HSFVHHPASSAIYALSLHDALPILLESLLTAKLVDDITDTRSNKTRESWAQGAANIVSGFLGGMGGCAVVGQTMMNVRASGARRSEEHTSELQSRFDLVCRLLLEKK